MAPIEDEKLQVHHPRDGHDDASRGDAPPAAKRVRFSTVVPSNDATRLAIVACISWHGTVVNDAQMQEQQAAGCFPPRFTYHAFGTDESIQGYEGLKICVYFNAYDFNAYVDVQYKEKESSADDIIAKISSSLPEGFTQEKAAFIENVRIAEQDFAPPGELVASYTKQVEDDRDRYFEIYEVQLEGNDAAQKLHLRMQTMALWFIEGADGIDVTDPRWVVYLTYERSAPGDGSFRPVGYITLFKFSNPLGRKLSTMDPDRNETHRICQVLIFPTHQRQGHGENLVQCIVERVVANDKVYELTVEDPVPAFSQKQTTCVPNRVRLRVDNNQLRNFVDVKNCLAHNFFSLPPSDSTTVPAQGTASLQASDIHAVQKKLKITQKQVQTCYEVLKLRFVDKANDEQYKKYRLEVKKRLFKLHAEELEGMASGDRRKAFLEVEYQALDEHYTHLLAKIGAVPCVAKTSNTN